MVAAVRSSDCLRLPPQAVLGPKLFFTVSTVSEVVSTTDKCPWSSLVFDAKGNLYGTTVAGGAKGCYDLTCGGTVFQLTPPATKGNPWMETLIYEFASYPNGSSPLSNLIFDKNGHLYGTTQIGGTGSCLDDNGFPDGCGTIFSLSPPASGTEWTLATLYSFTAGNDGAFPFSGLSFEGKGNLYGTARAGGGSG